MLISKYFVLFIFYSFLGWVWESVYCTLTRKHFLSRGFLFGPICPIYGFGALGVQILFVHGSAAVFTGLEGWQIFLICMALSAVLEYVVSWYLETRFHARWWDYSSLPLNLNGRICLPISMCFGAAGVILAKYAIPAIVGSVGHIPDIAYEILALVLMGILGADFALTEASLTSLVQKIENLEAEFTDRANTAYQTIASAPGAVGSRIRYTEEEIVARSKALASSLTDGQKFIVRNIRSFRPPKPSLNSPRIGERVREFIESRKDEKES